MRTRIVAAITSLALIGAWAVAGAGRAAAQAQPKPSQAAGREIRIGAVVPGSGPFAEWGKTNTIALQMLEEEVNAAGGVRGRPLKIVVYDDGARPAEAANLVRRLASDDRVLAIAGPLTSSTAEVAFPVANQLRIVAVSQASSKPGVAARNRPWAFRNTVDEATFAGATVPVFKELFNVGSAAIIYDAKDANSVALGTKIMPEVLKTHGIKTLNEQSILSFQTGDIDVSAQVTALKGLKPDGVVVAADYSQAITVIREMKRQGLISPVIGGSPLISSAILQAAPEVPIVAPATYYVGIPGERARRFTEALQARFRQASNLPPTTEPNMYDANIYEIVRMFLEAIERGEAAGQAEDLAKQRERIMQYLTALKSFEGLIGPISMNRDGDATKRFYVVVGKDGKWTPRREACSAPGGC